MKGLFIDTAGWMACADAGDPAHLGACAARDTAREQGLLLVTTDYVLDEMLTLIRMRIGLPAAKSWWQQIQGSSRVRLEWVGMERADNARKAFFRFRHKITPSPTAQATW
ncbi:MAG: hypothetical protein EXR29_03000 [Betaproteobacteria bacterium]|nr:hypothetical protein [Betaproteobacteria bacterium]